MKISELFESASADSLKLKLSAIVNQIASRYIDTGANKPMSLEALLSKLSDLGINISEQQFREMVKDEPLKNTIANVSGDKVTFLGQQGKSSESIKPNQSTSTLEKMAKRAEKKREK